jgi:Cu2+-containing amine oxidase
LFGTPQGIAPKRAALVVVDLRSNRIVRVQTEDFEYLQNQEIPNDLARLMEALGRGRPIDLTEP